jgi:cell division protein ZapE
LILKIAYYMNLIQIYHQRLEQEGFDEDPYQIQMLQSLQRIADGLLQQPVATGWRTWFAQKQATVQGLYVWGGVGRGKTWVMDLFFEHLPEERKGRLHFHRFMQYVHAEMAKIKEQTDPLNLVAKNMAEKWRVLCLDEFNVIDIGDAMILAGLLRSLFEQGVVLVTTSNVVPENLYPDGIQRASFLPAIALLEQHTEVLALGGDRDYRQAFLAQARVYHSPLGMETDAKLQLEFKRMASAHIEQEGSLEINGRAMHYRFLSESMVWFDFEALCGPPRSQHDYIELARCQSTVFLSDVPVMGPMFDDKMRRFILLIDEFYDRKVKLILSAEATADKLYVGERLAFEYQRTLSRLTEMQTPAYLGSEHRG